MQKGSEELCRRRWQVVSSKSQVHLYTFIRKTNDVVGDDGADVGAMMGIAMVMAGVPPTSPGNSRIATKFLDRSLWGPSQNQKNMNFDRKIIGPCYTLSTWFSFCASDAPVPLDLLKNPRFEPKFWNRSLWGPSENCTFFDFSENRPTPPSLLIYFLHFFQNGPKIDIWKIMIFRAPLWPHFQFFWPIVKYKNLWGAKAPPQPGQAGGASHHQLGQALGGGAFAPHKFLYLTSCQKNWKCGIDKKMWLIKMTSYLKIHTWQFVFAKRNAQKYVYFHEFCTFHLKETHEKPQWWNAKKLWGAVQEKVASGK